MNKLEAKGLIADLMAEDLINNWHFEDIIKFINENYEDSNRNDIPEYPEVQEDEVIQVQEQARENQYDYVFMDRVTKLDNLFYNNEMSRQVYIYEMRDAIREVQKRERSRNVRRPSRGYPLVRRDEDE